MSRQIRRTNLPQVSSRNYLDTNFVDTNYEEVDDDYNYGDRHSDNNRWHNRAYRVGRNARNTYDWGQNYSRGITPAMENGASAALRLWR